jgi:Tfp pilus assembly protein PilX
MEHRHASRGVALVATLGILLVVGLLVLASAVTGIIDRTVSANQHRSNAAYYVAQTGLDVYKTAIFRNLVDLYHETGDNWCENPLSGGITDGDGVVVLPLASGPDDDDSWTEWMDSGQGRYRVRLYLTDQYLVLTSQGEVADGRSTVQLVAHAGGGPGSAWDNAILARGRTPGSRAINGNVIVYGSVHIVEGHIDVDGTFAISGTAGVFNDYTGKDSAANSNIVADIDSIVDTNVDLCARVKIAKGNIYLESGAVQLGTNVESIYSIHLGDGFVCNQKESDGSCRPRNVVENHHDSSSVYLRYPEGPGINSPYDPFDMDLPIVNQAAFDRSFKTTSFDESAGVWVPVTGCEWLYDGDGNVTLPPLDPTATSSLCGDADSSVQWMGTADGGYLAIAGDVNVNSGDLLVNGELLYSGTGTLLVGANLDDADARVMFGEHGSVRPVDDLTYLNTSSLGLLTTGDMAVGATAANDPFAALLYAKGTFSAEKQIIVVGAVVAEDFDLGTNVPKIAYHPGVRDAAEVLCMPGTACSEGGTPQQPGALADIAIERR